MQSRRRSKNQCTHAGEVTRQWWDTQARGGVRKPNREPESMSALSLPRDELGDRGVVRTNDGMSAHVLPEIQGRTQTHAANWHLTHASQA